MNQTWFLGKSLSFMAWFRYLWIVLAAEVFSLIVVKFQAADGFRIIPAGAGRNADPPLIAGMIAPGPVIQDIRKHHSPDDSSVGGDVILGGFMMVAVVAVAGYLHVTRRKTPKPSF